MADTSEPNTERRPTMQEHLMANKFDAVLLLIRLYIIFATFVFMVPVFGMEYSVTCFKRVLLGNACISALRMHQRLPRVTLTKEFLQVLIMEDSFHYFVYSILFLNSNPQTIALAPIVVFAVLHSASYTHKLIATTGATDTIATTVQSLTSKIVERNMQTSILTFIASMEIMVFFVAIVMIFVGRGSFLVPFFYYRFLQLRYMSRRNPYSRLVFGQLRMKVEAMARNESTPAFAKKGLTMLVSVASKLSPTTMAQPAAQ
jgi:hypothetical protein